MLHIIVCLMKILLPISQLGPEEYQQTNNFTINPD